MKTREFKLSTLILTFILGLGIGAGLIGFAFQYTFKDVMAEQEAKLKASITEQKTTADQTNSTTELTHTVEHSNPAPKKGTTYEEGSIQFLNENLVDIQELYRAQQPVGPNGEMAHGRAPLQPATDYYIQYNFPDRLKAEIENGDYDFEVTANYSFEVDRGENFRVDLTVHNLNSGNSYTCTSRINAGGDLCVKHFPKNYEGLTIKDDCVYFRIQTSALPDDGPKVSNNAFYSVLDCRYSLSGVEDWSNPIPSIK